MMLIKSEFQHDIEYSSNKTSTDKPRKIYQKPLLEELGDLRTVTLGGSPGFGDSGGGVTCEFSGIGGDGYCGP